MIAATHNDRQGLTEVIFITIKIGVVKFRHCARPDDCSTVESRNVRQERSSVIEFRMRLTIGLLSV